MHVTRLLHETCSISVNFFHTTLLFLYLFFSFLFSILSRQAELVSTVASGILFACFPTVECISYRSGFLFMTSSILSFMVYLFPFWSFFLQLSVIFSNFLVEKGWTRPKRVPVWGCTKHLKAGQNTQQVSFAKLDINAAYGSNGADQVTM